MSLLQKYKENSTKVINDESKKEFPKSILKNPLEHRTASTPIPVEQLISHRFPETKSPNSPSLSQMSQSKSYIH